MASSDASPPDPAAERAAVRSERLELLAHLQAVLEPTMVVLGLIFLVLLLIDYSGAALTAGQRRWLDRTLTAIWVAFVADFLLRLIVAPAKGRFLRENWLGALSLVLPILRPLRALRALRAVRSLRLVRLLGGVNRGMRVLQQVARGRQFAYVGALTLLVTLAGAVGVLFFDRGVEGAPIQTFGDALWWSAALVTTINSEQHVVSFEARVIALLMRLYAVSVFGFVTAAIASYLVGRAAEERAETAAAARPAAIDDSGRHEDLAHLEREIRLLRKDLAATRAAVARSAAGGENRSMDARFHDGSPRS